jgi:ABC-type branched-subunit amino acid transport system substrate-binding protein
MNRRTLVIGIAVVALVGMLASLPNGVTAQGKVVKIGLSLPLTGADADGADAILKGAQMAIAA